jgi:hypothetical protein
VDGPRRSPYDAAAGVVLAGHDRRDQGRVSAPPVAIQVWVMLMQDVNRRRFLQLAGGSIAATMLSDSIARAATILANRRTRSLKDVEHIVVLMQENRSFDHSLSAGRPRPTARARRHPGRGLRRPELSSTYVRSPG